MTVLHSQGFAGKSPVTSEATLYVANPAITSKGSAVASLLLSDAKGSLKEALLGSGEFRLPPRSGVAIQVCFDSATLRELQSAVKSALRGKRVRVQLHALAQIAGSQLTLAKDVSQAQADSLIPGD
jgi:isocitrate dehydrogenase